MDTVSWVQKEEVDEGSQILGFNLDLFSKVSDECANPTKLVDDRGLSYLI